MKPFCRVRNFTGVAGTVGVVGSDGLFAHFPTAQGTGDPTENFRLRRHLNAEACFLPMDCVCLKDKADTARYKKMTS